jgi:Rps23 Pro-64 3,4-dihydroxylase Tpa1-like proline 4-hydroxylase
MIPESLLASPELLQQAETRGRARLSADPGNPTLLESLADLYRKQGRLRDAAALYERLIAIRPEDPRLRYAHAVMSRAVWSERPTGIQPSPFVLLDNFLPSALHDALMPFMIAAEPRLTPAMVGQNEYNSNARESLELRDDREAAELQRAVAKQIRGVIPAMIARLHIEPFEYDRLEVKMRVYADGHFFRVHMDNPPNNPETCNRQISYVYFYHRVPRAYSGGDLILFDTDVANNQYSTAAFTRVEPEDNSIVFFPSGCYHSVVPVKCPTKQIADSRFAINGHVSKKAAKPEVGASQQAASPGQTASAEAMSSADAAAGIPS